MGRDSQITLSLFLTYLVYGFLYFFDDRREFIVLPPLIVLFVPVLCLIFFFWTKKSIGTLFFLTYPLFAVAILLEAYFKQPLNWVHYLTFLSLPTIIHTLWMEWERLKSLRWWMVLVTALLTTGLLSYLFFPSYLVFILLPLLLICLFILISIRYLPDAPLSDLSKRIVLVLAFTSSIVATTFFTIAR